MEVHPERGIHPFGPFYPTKEEVSIRSPTSPLASPLPLLTFPHFSFPGPTFSLLGPCFVRSENRVISSTYFRNLLSLFILPPSKPPHRRPSRLFFPLPFPLFLLPFPSTMTDHKNSIDLELEKQEVQHTEAGGVQDIVFSDRPALEKKLLVRRVSPPSLPWSLSPLTSLLFFLPPPAKSRCSNVHPQ